MNKEKIIEPEKQITDKEIDPYLKSAKAFHLEMPLYHKLDLSNEDILEKVFTHLLFNQTIDAHCVECGKSSVFQVSDRTQIDFSHAVHWASRDDGLYEMVFECTRDASHLCQTYYHKLGMAFTKIGQFPSVADFQIPQAEKYRKILDKEQYKELTKGIGLHAHGVGIGSFVYLRRVFEHLIEEAYTQAQSKIDGFKKDDYLKARMDEKIKMIKEYLPEFLVENRKIYSIMGKGLHELSEDECLIYFDIVRSGIEQILDEKIFQKEKSDKTLEVSKAIEKLHADLNN